MIQSLARRAVRAVRWRLHALLGTGSRLPAQEAGSRYGSDDVAAYYDAFTQTYLDATGRYLQAFRGRDTDALMRYYIERCAIEDGMTILDAGCGVGAPAIWLAKRFPHSRIECLTNSRVQSEIAQRSAAEVDLSDRVVVRHGDYHHLPNIYANEQFDRALFFESLGHSDDPTKVLYGLRDVLKQGGEVYIKDFFQRRSRNLDLQAKIDHAVATINSNYRYNVMQLPDLIAACMETGFSIASVRPPGIDPDLGITIDFEHAARRLTYPIFTNVHAVEWYEVVARRE